MRNSRFIELLNLYIDHQLTPAEAAELEAEINRDEQRRCTYNQYCRMQKACSVLFEHERSAAPSSRVLNASLYDVERKVVGSSERRIAFGFPSFATIGLAAAACIAFVVVVNRTPRLGNTFDVTASKEVTPAQRAPVVVAATAPSQTASKVREASPQTRPSVRESLFAVSNVRPFGTDDSPSELMLDSMSDAVPSYDWMQKVELTPVASLSDRITLQPINTSFTNRTLVLRRGNQAAVERAAFQFQR
ncbi:MAG TPA: hypothetical protein VFT72_15515 [Opitutaceae bacterium]|nr:hypothetical protein [Opitutaceae bacterium]